MAKIPGATPIGAPQTRGLRFASPAEPAYEFGGQSGGLFSLIGRSVDVSRRFAHGVGAAMLFFTGAGAMTRSGVDGQPLQALRDALAGIDFGSPEAIINAAGLDVFAGPMQIFCAASLFLLAGRCAARYFGLLAAGGIVYLYTQGVSIDDASLYTSNFLDRLDAARMAFLTVDVG